MSQANWLQKLLGFEEESPEQVRANLLIEGQDLISTVNGQRYQMGSFQLASLGDLKRMASIQQAGALQLKEVVGDVQDYHCMQDNQGALFQAASQFNMLEMVNPEITPEMGLWRYQHDHTQGPACAIACGAGTVFRNYLVPVKDGLGQTASRQIDGLEDIASWFDNEQEQLWQMKNGYVLASAEGLQKISAKIEALSQLERQALKERLKIGLQLDTQVTIFPERRIVSQVYCSALPVAYSAVAAGYWEAFARLILEATYEATLYAALYNRSRTGNKRVYLTLVGGGAFGNKAEWIIEAVTQALDRFRKENLEVIFISYGGKSEVVQEIMQSQSTY